MNTEQRPGEQVFDALDDVQFGATIAGVLLICGLDWHYVIGAALLAFGLGCDALFDSLSLTKKIAQALRRAGHDSGEQGT